MLRICLKNKVHTSQLVNANIKWHFHDTGRHVRRTFKTKCKLLSWETSLSGAVKPRFSTALRSEPGGWGSNEIRDSQMWAASPLREDLPTCSSEPSLVGWHERGWCWQGAGRAIHGHPWWKHPALSLTPSTVRATRTCPGHGGSPIIARPGGRSVPPAMCEVPRGAHKPLKLHVLWGMTNKGLQSFEKAEFLDDYPNQISESFEDGLSPLRGSILRGTGRSCNRLTSF